MAGKKMQQLFWQECLNDVVLLPNVLLRHYPVLGLEDADLVILLRIFSARPADLSSLTAQDLAAAFGGEEQAELALAALAGKGVAEKKSGRFSLTPLYDRLLDIWALEKAQLSSAKKAFAQTAAEKDVFSCFSTEFGRLLTPMEREQIDKWMDEDGFSQEMLAEALRRAVLAGKYSFAYIDKILLRWKRDRICTLAQVEADDKKRQATAGKRASSAGARRKSERDDDYACV